jgi:hypothetical protein
MIKDMVKECLLIKIKIFTLECGQMARSMVRELMYIIALIAE